MTKRPKAWAEEQLCVMLKTMLHEPFYISGVWSEPSLGVYVGWVARRGSFSAAMPVRNERQDITLSFSGEEYPDVGIIEALRAKGHDVEQEGASYLAHRYEEGRG